jgi:hypothetical protein
MCPIKRDILMIRFGMCPIDKETVKDLSALLLLQASAEIGY